MLCLIKINITGGLMKRTLAIVLTTAMLLGAMAVFAGYYSNEKGNRNNYRYENYKDNDEDGVCDHYEKYGNNRNNYYYRNRRNCPNGNRMRNNNK